jgi:hypothetical protein
MFILFMLDGLGSKRTKMGHNKENREKLSFSEGLEVSQCPKSPSHMSGIKNKVFLKTKRANFFSCSENILILSPYKS